MITALCRSSSRSADGALVQKRSVRLTTENISGDTRAGATQQSDLMKDERALLVEEMHVGDGEIQHRCGHAQDVCAARHDLAEGASAELGKIATHHDDDASGHATSGERHIRHEAEVAHVELGEVLLVPPHFLGQPHSGTINYAVEHPQLRPAARERRITMQALASNEAAVHVRATRDRRPTRKSAMLPKRRSAMRARRGVAATRCAGEGRGTRTAPLGMDGSASDRGDDSSMGHISTMRMRRRSGAGSVRSDKLTGHRHRDDRCNAARCASGGSCGARVTLRGPQRASRRLAREVAHRVPLREGGTHARSRCGRRRGHRSRHRTRQSRRPNRR